jgi:YVTN family beta-propeller protein
MQPPVTPLKLVPLLFVILTLLSLSQSVISSFGSAEAVSQSSIRVVAKLEVGYDPSGLTFDSQSKLMYVTADSNYNFYSRFPTGIISLVNSSNKVVKAFHFWTSNNFGLAYDSLHNRVFLSSGYRRPYVAVFRDNRWVGQVAVGIDPDGLVYDPDNKFVYVAVYYEALVDVINTTTLTVAKSIHVGEPGTNGPFLLAYDSSNHEVYATDYGQGVWAINATSNSVVAHISGIGGTRGVAYDPSNKMIYVGGGGSGSPLYEINGTTNNIVRNITAISGPYAVGYDPANKYLYVGSCCDQNVTVFDPNTNRLVKSVGLTEGHAFLVIVYDPANSDMFVTSYDSPYLYVLSS